MEGTSKEEARTKYVEKLLEVRLVSCLFAERAHNMLTDAHILFVMRRIDSERVWRRGIEEVHRRDRGCLSHTSQCVRC